MKKARVLSDLTELKSGNVFRIRSVHDIFRKLYREMQRFEKAGSDNEGRQNQVDAAVNFAITAWHMTDWVWHRKKHELGECFKVTSKKQFQEEMRRRCLDLAVCDVIANAAKHGEPLRPMLHRPEIETVLVAHPVAEGAAGVELIATQKDRQWSLKIEVNGTPKDPHALFRRVFLCWHKFIQQHFVAEKSS